MKKIHLLILATLSIGCINLSPAHSSRLPTCITEEQRKAPYEWTVDVPLVKPQLQYYKELYKPYIEKQKDISDHPLDAFAELGKQGFSHTLKGLTYQWQLDLLHHFWSEFKWHADHKHLTITTFQYHMHRLIFLCNPTPPTTLGTTTKYFPASLLENDNWRYLESYYKAYDSDVPNIKPSSFPSCYRAIIFSKEGGISSSTLLSGVYAFNQAPLNLAAFAISPGEKGHNGMISFPTSFFSHDLAHMDLMNTMFLKYPFVYDHFKRIFAEVNADENIKKMTAQEKQLVINSLTLLTHELLPVYVEQGFEIPGNSPSVHVFWKQISKYTIDCFLPYLQRRKKPETLFFKPTLSQELQMLLPFKNLITTSYIKDLKDNKFLTHIKIESELGQAIFGQQQPEFLLVLDKIKNPKDTFNHRKVPYDNEFKNNRYEIIKVLPLKTTDVISKGNSFPYNKGGSKQTFEEVIKNHLLNKQFKMSTVYDFLLRDWANTYFESYQGQPGFGPVIDNYPDPIQLKEFFTKMFKDAGNVIRKVMDE